MTKYIETLNWLPKTAKEQEIERLKAALEQYADPDNWIYDMETSDILWIGDGNGPNIAREALKVLKGGDQ